MKEMAFTGILDSSYDAMAARRIFLSMRAKKTASIGIVKKSHKFPIIHGRCIIKVMESSGRLSCITIISTKGEF